MLDTFASVERALTRYTDVLQPRTSSVSTLSRTSAGGDRFPFHPGLLDDLEERSELRRRLRWLEDEEALVLLRWYIEGARPELIAGALRRSVRHVYRRRVSAIERIVALGSADEFADADLAEFV
jgi:hypothetical protein